MFVAAGCGAPAFLSARGWEDRIPTRTSALQGPTLASRNRVRDGFLSPSFPMGQEVVVPEAAPLGKARRMTAAGSDGSDPGQRKRRPGLCWSHCRLEVGDAADWKSALPSCDTDAENLDMLEPCLAYGSRFGPVGRLSSRVPGARKQKWDAPTHVPRRAPPSALEGTLSARPSCGRASSVGLPSKLAVSSWSTAEAR